MKTRKARRVLVAAFLGLSKVERKRLKHHLEKKTPIMCGANYHLYADGDGGA